MPELSDRSLIKKLTNKHNSIKEDHWLNENGSIKPMRSLRFVLRVIAAVCRVESGCHKFLTNNLFPKKVL